MDEIATKANIDKDFRLVIDTGSTTSTIIPYFVRERVKDSDRGWDKHYQLAGYGGGVNITPGYVSWEVSLGDGTNWTEWIETSELYCWQKKLPLCRLWA
ncbi:unnamed protein product [Rhizophagus irregularis]|nr:unnamed protein product [Rhizophagus irregularis]